MSRKQRVDEPCALAPPGLLLYSWRMSFSTACDDGGTKPASLLKRLSITMMLTTMLAAGCSRRAGETSPFACGPYLDHAGTNGITLRWTSDQLAAGRVRWGRAGQPLDREAPAEVTEYRYVRDAALHRKAHETLPAEAFASARFYAARLAGLDPGVEYSYAVEFRGQRATGGFRTFPNRPEPFTFVTFSDTHGSDVVAEHFAAHKPALLLNCGDLVDKERYDEYRQFFSPAVQAATGNLPMFVTRGNHDESGKLLARLFSFPEGRLYYSFDYANAHFVCLDSCLWRGSGATTNVAAMLEWCERDLAASQADWKIVFFHEPPYDLSYRRTDWGRENALPILRRHGVDLIFCGHVHSYQRFAPLYWPGQNDEHPILLVLAAGAGSKYLAMPRRAEPHLAVRAGESHYVVCRVEGERLTLRALTPGGRELDRLTIVKRDGRLDPAYLAMAMPEETFGAIEQSLSSLSIAKPELAAGEEFSLRLRLRAGSEPYDFEIRPAHDTAHVAELVAPVQGTVPTNGVVEVSVALRARVAIRKQEKGNRAEPLFALDCHYRTGGREGVISSEVLRVRLPPAPPVAN